MLTELYKKYRPQLLDEVVGNDSLKATLRAYVKSGTTPHFILLTGPSGNGKTTIARILARGLKISQQDYLELNCACDNGIDMTRNLRDKAPLSPMNSPARMIVVDECHQLTKQAQEGLLKLLEDTPSHLYYVFCTTDPGKLLPTIKTRATQMVVDLLTDAQIRALCQRVANSEGMIITDDEVWDKLAEYATGSARKALVYLGQVKAAIVGGSDPTKVFVDSATEAAAFEIAQALQRGAKWADISAKIKACTEEPETVRRIIAGYFTTVLLGATQSPQRSAAILGLLIKPWYETPKAQMVNTLYLCTLVT